MRHAAGRFFDAAKRADKGQASGQLAQDVQRSGFPARYGQVAGRAGAILRSTKGGASASSGTRTVPGTDRSGDRQALLQQYLTQRHDPDALLALNQGLKGAKDTPARTVKTTSPSRQGSGKMSIVGIGKLAQQMGLHVGENSHFGGVNPVHVKGSYHYKDRAIDVSGDPQKMARFARTVQRRYGKSLKELFYNGPGGVNVKNGKRVGKGFVSGHTDHVHVAG